jgi:hypothetical protein
MLVFISTESWSMESWSMNGGPETEGCRDSQWRETSWVSKISRDVDSPGEGEVYLAQLDSEAPGSSLTKL